jgi:hypothetical protein
MPLREQISIAVPPTDMDIYIDCLTRHREASIDFIDELIVAVNESSSLSPERAARLNLLKDRYNDAAERFNLFVEQHRTS